MLSISLCEIEKGEQQQHACKQSITAKEKESVKTRHLTNCGVPLVYIYIYIHIYTYNHTALAILRSLHFLQQQCAAQKITEPIPSGINGLFFEILSIPPPSPKEKKNPFLLLTRDVKEELHETDVRRDMGKGRDEGSQLRGGM